MIATCSYSRWSPEVGVPLVTSIGQPKWEPWPTAHQIDDLKPFGIFRRMDDKPLEERIAAYHSRLDGRRGQIEKRFADLAERYPGQPLVVCCWCNLLAEDVGRRGCHRRWFAEWMLDRFGLAVPEWTLRDTWAQNDDTPAEPVQEEARLF